jgi:sugar phosphate isomerase/epimerase
MPGFVGISSSYFATRGNNIYDSVRKASEMGFHTVELGAAHRFEQDVWGTLRKIRGDFPGTTFTVHGLFPPQRERFWFNASLGLTSRNKATLQQMFRAAEMLGAGIVGIHPGFASRVGWGEEMHGLNVGIPLERLKRADAISGLKEVIGFALELGEKSGVKFAVENIPAKPEGALLYKKEHFQELFDEFPKLLFLFDLGHAMAAKRVEELLELHPRIGEMHMHYASGSSPFRSSLDAHDPFPENFDFSFLKRVRQLLTIPLVFEHGNNVGEQQLLQEKEALERFLEKQGD